MPSRTILVLGGVLTHTRTRTARRSCATRIGAVLLVLGAVILVLGLVHLPIPCIPYIIPYSSLTLTVTYFIHLLIPYSYFSLTVPYHLPFLGP